MTAWCSSTTSVRKVRARSSEGLRVLAWGTAPTSACPTVEIDVMHASQPSYSGQNAARNLIQQGPIEHRRTALAREAASEPHDIQGVATCPSFRGFNPLASPRNEVALGYATSSIVTLSG